MADPIKPTIIKVTATNATTSDKLKITNLTDTSLAPVTVNFDASAKAIYDLANMTFTASDSILLEVVGAYVGTDTLTVTEGTSSAKTITLTSVSSTNCPAISL